MSRKKTVLDYEAEAIKIGTCLIHTAGVARKVYQLRHGKVSEGLEVCHTCDVNYCINDAHHFLGTHAENMRDAKLKGRLQHTTTYKLHMKVVFKKLWKDPAYKARMLAIYATEESRQRRGAVHKGVPKTDTHKSRMAKSKLGSKASKSAKENMSTAQKCAWAEGRYAGNIGRKRTAEMRNSMSLAALKRYNRTSA